MRMNVGTKDILLVEDTDPKEKVKVCRQAVLRKVKDAAECSLRGESGKVEKVTGSGHMPPKKVNGGKNLVERY